MLSLRLEQRLHFGLVIDFAEDSSEINGEVVWRHSWLSSLAPESAFLSILLTGGEKILEIHILVSIQKKPKIKRNIW